MMFGSILLVGLSLALPAQSSSPPPQQSGCAQALAGGLIDGAASEICAGDEAMRLANAAPKDSAEKTRLLRGAAEHYRRGVTLTSKVDTKVLALNLLVGSYDAQHLNEPTEVEAALREVIGLTPDDLAPMFRLAKLQEDQGLIDDAEDTLLDARHKQPDQIEPNKMLAQFYARRVTALHKQELPQEPQTVSNPGEPDENGIYRVGGGLKAPSRVDIAQYPADARAAGISGTVIAEIVVDPSGNVSDAKVVRSIPLLDDAALQAVRNWRYAPTVVNGEPVPVRIVVTVNFTLPTPPSPAVPTPQRR